MINYPTTLAEAKRYKYNQWGGNPRGTPYIQEKCAYNVYGTNITIAGRQCSRKNGYGPAGLYCKQHAKVVGD